MKVVIIEDETLASKKLEKLLLDLDPEIEVLAILDSVKSALKWFDQNELPHLIFSDIQLGDGLSFDIFQEMNLACPVIFTTAFNQYAIQAFEVNSIDYLLKPIQRDRIEKSLEKYLSKKEAWNPPVDGLDFKMIINAINEAKHSFKSRFLVKLGNKIHSIKTDDIAYFYSENKVTYLVENLGQKYPLDQSLDEISNQVNPELYFRANRQFLIHLDSAVEIKPYFKGRLKIALRPGAEEEVIISSEKSSEFKSWLDR